MAGIAVFFMKLLKQFHFHLINKMPVAALWLGCTLLALCLEVNDSKLLRKFLFRSLIFLKNKNHSIPQINGRF